MLKNHHNITLILIHFVSLHRLSDGLQDVRHPVEGLEDAS